MAMVKDLQERANELPMHDVIAAIAGDSRLRAPERGAERSRRERVRPDYTYDVLDENASVRARPNQVEVRDVAASRHTRMPKRARAFSRSLARRRSCRR
jgi:hypothetical protein